MQVVANASPVMNLAIIGRLDLLMLYAAKQKGCIAAIGPELNALRHKAGFWISDRLVEHALRTAGECP